MPNLEQAFVGERTRFDREMILARLHATVEEGRPIIAAGSSAGIIAKAAEIGGADLIIVYATGLSRMMGLPTTRLGDSNEVTLALFDEIANVVDDTPIIGGAEATDPTYRRLPRLVRSFRERGFDGIINHPSVGNRREYAAQREHVGQGVGQEAAMIDVARREGYFTIGYAYHVEQARMLSAAGVDVQVAHAGWTTGGGSGARDNGADSLPAAAEHVQAIVEATREEQPDCICLAHGGPIAEPLDTAYIYEHTDVKGFVGASSIERIPVERAVADAVRAFKSVEGMKREGDDDNLTVATRWDIE